MDPSIDSSRGEPNRYDPRREQGNQPPAETTTQRSDPPRDNPLDQIKNLPPRDIGSAAVGTKDRAAQEVDPITLSKFTPEQPRSALGRVIDFVNDHFPLPRDVCALVSDLCRNPFNIGRTGGVGTYCRTLLWDSSAIVSGLLMGGAGGLGYASIVWLPAHFKLITIPDPVLWTMMGIAGICGLVGGYRDGSNALVEDKIRDLGQLRGRSSCDKGSAGAHGPQV